MTGIWRPLALAAIGFLAVDLGSANAQVVVTGGRSVVVTPAAPVVNGPPVVVKTRRPWRARNPYFVARPNYAPAPPGARANITFAPFTSKYYPNENSYYPPLYPSPSIRPR